MESLKRVISIKDNVNLSIKAFNCDSNEARELKKVIFDRIWFSNLCVDKEKDNRPVVYLNSPDFYFNITKSLVVEDVIFDGINAFGHIRNLNSFNGAKKIQTWTEKLCEIETPKDFKV